jgi:cell division protein FtsL
MKKMVVRRKRIKWDSVLVAVFLFSAVLYLVASIGLKSFNVSLASKNQQNQQEIVQTKAEVDAISIQVKELSDYNRVMETVTDEGLNNSAVVVSISN